MRKDIAPKKEQVSQFVFERFGLERQQLLHSRTTGGLSNTRGRDYENFFQLFKVFEIASTYTDMSQHKVSQQVFGFVDDICHWDLHHKIKHNYQVKNTAGSTANWTENFSQDCREQKSIDFGCYKVNISKNYLLVSDKSKQEANQRKIPEDLRESSFSEYFPHCDNLLELLEKTQLKRYISSLMCLDKPINDLEKLNYPAQIVLGLLQARHYDDDTLEVIFQQANASANPAFYLNIGNQKLELEQVDIPDWLTQFFVNSSTTVQFHLEYPKLCLIFASGLEISVPLNVLQQISQEQVQQVPKSDVRALVALLSQSAAVALSNTAEELIDKEGLPIFLSESETR